MRARTLLIAVLGALAGAVPAPAAAPASCPGPGTPDRTFTGDFSSARQGSFVMLPFEVPARTTQVRVRYCYDQPESSGSGQAAHTLDLGLYEPQTPGARRWGIEQLRGWSGSGLDEVGVTPEGFSSTAQYRADPNGYVPGRTSRGYLPGRIPAGRWAVELGLANIASQSEGDLDGKVAYRVEILLDDNPAFADRPYRAPRFDGRPAREKPGWYAGDFHVHGEHSGDAEATMDETFDFAFRPVARGGAGLDFVTLADHNTGSAWPEIARRRADHPRHLVVRSQEVTTYRGHSNSHASGQSADYRTGPLLERRSDGTLRLLRGRRPAQSFLSAVRRAGGLTQVNHPTLFPSPPFPSNLCRGCEWDYLPAQTGYGLVDAIEIATGPAGVGSGPNPFTATAIDFWEDKLARGHRIAAVGGSDSHRADRVEGPTQSPVGEPTTVVYARELSERGVRDAVRAGHTYVKLAGSDGPDLRFSARAAGTAGPAAIMGDSVRGDRVRFVARVLGGSPRGAPYTLTVLKDGQTPVRTAPVTGDDFRLDFDATEPGRYRLELTRGTAIEAVSSPIYVTAGAPPGGGGSGPGGGSSPGGEGGGADGDDGSGTDGRDGRASSARGRSSAGS